MMSSFAVRAALGVALVTLASVPAAAQKPKKESVLSFSGTATALDVGAPGVRLTFDPTAVGQELPAEFGFPLTPTPATGSFEGLRGAPVALGSFLVGSGAQYVPNLLTLGGYTFTLTEVPAGRGGLDGCYVAPAAGQTCSPIQKPGSAISPFELVNFPQPANAEIPSATGLYSYASFRFFGTVRGPRGSAFAPFEGTIATIFPASFQETLAYLEFESGVGGAGYGKGSGLAGVPYTATFVIGENAAFNAAVTTTPEPGTVALAGFGLVAVAGAARARRRRGA